MNIRKRLVFCFFFFLCSTLEASLFVGTGVCEITPPIGTPSAGYTARQGQGMEGIHDPLLATTLFLDAGEKKIAICTVDHLGFDYGMVQEVKRLTPLKNCEIYICSSHTHSGGGAFLNIDGLGEKLAGKYDPTLRKKYIQGAVNSILAASDSLQEAKIGFGKCQLLGLTHYRSGWPLEVVPPQELHVIKITSLDGEPLAVLFNYALHPTTLGKTNMLFSADFVGAARFCLKELLGKRVEVFFVNGAQAELIPKNEAQKEEWALCREVGKAFSDAVYTLWQEIDVREGLSIFTLRYPYSFASSLLQGSYFSEISCLRLNEKEAILTVPGELSCLYEMELSKYAEKLGLDLMLFGLTNDAHGYIITPEAWDHQTKESQLSFGGRLYGERVAQLMRQLLLASADAL